MFFRFVICTPLILSAIAASAELQSVRVNVPTDPKASYTIVIQDLGYGKEALSVISKRIGPSGTSFAIREVNCFDQTFRYLGEGDTLEEAMENLDDNSKMSRLVSGSITHYIVQAACR